MAMALSGARVFDGTRLLHGHTVIIDGGRIAAVVPDRDVPDGVTRRAVTGLLAPGFVDWQVNGGGGVLFNDETTVEGIAAIGAAHRRFGTVAFLPTLITDTRDKMHAALTATTAAISVRQPGVVGVHLEGPFLNPERKGVHDPRFMRAIDEDDFAVITGAKAGRIVMTVAPEKMPPGSIARLVRAGITLSAGHTAASYDAIRAARSSGLTGFTHLFNGMPPLTGREPGPVGAALDDPEAWCGIIADMHHVSAVSLRVAFAARGWQRTTLVTDAMPTVGSAKTKFMLLGRTVHKREGTLMTEDGSTLAGSDLDMATAVRNSVTRLGLPLEAALHMASRAPAEFLGLGAELGRIVPGFRASLVLLDDQLAVTETWIDGAPSTN
ncbi:MAG TPA: N-acetylglucosamine-6-phosphate deacetylase [Bauldia sp.]|nr:N-acetylglucosamine-6-phosphate deacetylase [Bauldia sp.]